MIVRVSFGTYARRVRDRDLPYGVRYVALRCAVSHYCPIGFNASWSFVTSRGNVRVDETALIRALDILEASRSAWLSEMDAFAARRRVEKWQHRRSPTAAERLYLYGHRWPGPDGHAATLFEVRRLWAGHLAEPFPETPAETEGDLVNLDSTVAGCVSAYLNRDGLTSPGHREILLACLADLRRHLTRLGHLTPCYTAYNHFRRLHKLSELVINDVSESAGTGGRPYLGGSR